MKCGTSQEEFIEHTKKFAILEEKITTFEKGQRAIADNLAKLHQIICQSNGKQSLIDAIHETKNRVAKLEKQLIDNATEKKWAVDKILVIIGLVINAVIMYYKG